MHGSSTLPREVILAALVADHDGFLAATGALDEPVFVSDAVTLRFLAANGAAERLYGWGEDDLRRMTLFDIRTDDEARILREVVDNRAHELFRYRTWRHRRADGSEVRVRVTSAPLRFDGRDARLHVIVPVADAVGPGSPGHPSTSVDALTGLPDRGGFLTHTHRLLMRRGASRAPRALAVLGLDGFRSVNTTAGAAVGDSVLIAAAARMGRVVQGVDLVGRIAGDQFAVLLDHCPGDCAEEVGRSLADAVRAPFGVPGRSFFLTASVGVAVVDDDATAERLLIDATEAMHQAKSTGRDRVVVHRHADRIAIAERSALLTDLPMALRRDELLLHYQPVVEPGGRLVGAEALIRWDHPDRGLLLPGVFIPLAEESAFMRTLGRWVFHEAAGAARRLEDVGMSIPIAVNVSPRQFGPELVDEVRDALAGARLSPDRMVIEITESMLADPSLAAQTIDDLRDLGVAVWIDDFGTGFSCLANLVHLPVSGLKLDRTFVASIREPAGSSVIAAVTSLAHGLGLDVIAEGVETVEQLDDVVSLGADLIQGYLVSPPVSEARFVDFARSSVL